MRRMVSFAVGVVLVLAALGPAMADEEPDRRPAPELQPSWRDQGEAAYRARNWPDAIFLYRKWLEADPRDENTWYNLACCYALAGEAGAALDALETAVAAGWRDAAWPRQDPDLASLREEERFAAILARAAASKDADAPSAFSRHWVTYPAIGTYIAMLPPDYETGASSYPLVVILHGNGSTETRHGRLADRIGRDGVIYIAPRAPYPHHGVFTGMRQPGWTSAPQDAEPDAIGPLDPAQTYVASILAAVDDARRRYRMAGERFHVLGHSMGAFYANVTAMLHPTRVASYYAYAGGVPETFARPECALPLKEHGVRAHLGHGVADPVVGVDQTRKACELLRAAGVEVEMHLFEGVDHGIADVVVERIRAWVRDVVGKGP